MQKCFVFKMCKSSLPANPTVKNVIQNQWLHFGIVLAAIPEKMELQINDIKRVLTSFLSDG
jgi:hypothetical protein